MANKIEVGDTISTVRDSYGIADGLSGESMIPKGTIGTVIEVLPGGIMVTFNGRVEWEDLTGGEGICFCDDEYTLIMGTC